MNQKQIVKYEKDLFQWRQRAIGRLLLLARRDFLKKIDDQLKYNGYDNVPQPLLALTPYIDPEGTRNTVLAERMGISKQAVGKKIVELEKLGLLLREPDPSDGRAFLVYLTQASVEHVKALGLAIEQVEKKYIDKLGEQRFSELKKTLADMLN